MIATAAQGPPIPPDSTNEDPISSSSLSSSKEENGNLVLSGSTLATTALPVDTNANSVEKEKGPEKFHSNHNNNRCSSPKTVDTDKEEEVETEEEDEEEEEEEEACQADEGAVVKIEEAKDSSESHSPPSSLGVSDSNEQTKPMEASERHEHADVEKTSAKSSSCTGDDDDNQTSADQPEPVGVAHHPDDAQHTNGFLPASPTNLHETPQASSSAAVTDSPSISTPKTKGRSLSTEATIGSNSSHHLLAPATTTTPLTVTPAAPNKTSATTTTTTTTHSTHVRIPAYAAIKVIKGEIHNVLTMMRDQRYVSRSRFVTECVSPHPVAQALQELHGRLTAAADAQEQEELLSNHVMYLEAFCLAIEGQDISAAVTGAALQALHKFVLYGFVVGDSAGMTRIAQALLECRFEESRRPTDRRGRGPPQPAYYDDEQTVLKLLDVAALTVRTSLREDTVHLMDAQTIVRLLDACLHVSHHADQASALLKSAAASALGQIVLQVFASPAHPPVMAARKEILAKLVSLLNPKHQQHSQQQALQKSEDTTLSSQTSNNVKTPQAHHHQVIVASSLTLVNIALETCREPLTDDEICILQNDLFKYLLQWSSTTHDLMLLSLTLRLIFNLFQSIRNHLKVPLEVFLTSVHLRILSGHNFYSPEEKEVALESLVEFCQEPALMQDIFLNYDCDMACTNLYESIVAELGRAATPGWRDPHESYDEEDGEHGGDKDHRGQVHGGGEVGRRQAPSATSSNESLTPLSSGQQLEEELVPPVTHLERLGLEGLLAVLDSIAKRCNEIRRSATNSSTSSFENLLASRPQDEDDSSVGTFNDDIAPAISSQELHERKRKKHALQKVARLFNSNPMNEAWKTLALKENVLDEDLPAESVAKFLLTASHVDKAKVGIYLSKGPDKDYPFNAAVRDAFVARYDFKDHSFAAALRLYLSKFRLPGEAQCIDRLMESFSNEFYKQSESSMFFKNSDAIYVLAFSTIMLNTDLHNPTIKEESRMTKEQFIRNNRGINDGEDLPAEFLGELYDQIKNHEIQVRKELGEFMKKHEHEDFRTVWENMLSKKGEVATPFFTPTSIARTSSRLAGFHDKEMFIALSKSAVQAFSGIFLRSWDDALVVKALDALRTIARVAAFLGCDGIVSDVLQVLLPQGRDYVLGCIASGLHLADNASVVSNGPTVDSESLEDDDSTLVDEAEQPIPYGLLCSSRSDGEVDITGSAAHRGLLALDCGFVLMRKYSSRAGPSWPLFVECLCILRDARALPPGLSDLDDFADSNGNILPHTSFAKVSRKRLKDYYRSLSEKDTHSSKGWFRSFFRKKTSESDDIPDDISNFEEGELSHISRTMLAICESAGIESVVQLGLARLPDVAGTINALLCNLDAFPYKGNPVGEQHAIFSLELSARALLSNKDKATDLFALFLDKFESVIGKVSAKKVPAPFVIERIVVTILRCCIHLYDIAELRPHLRAALHLFFMSLPRSFIRALSDRMACGLAIILRASFHFFETYNDWAFMGDTLDMLAHYDTSRVFVFDGIASVVEYAIPSLDDSRASFFEDENRPSLSDEACSSLSKILMRFVLGFYHGDLSLAVPAILCLEKVYRRRVDILLEHTGTDESDDTSFMAPDKEYWQNITVAIYSVCRSSDQELSGHGMESFQRIVLQTSVNEIAEEKWLDVLFLMVSKQPPLAADASRCNTFSLLSETLVHVLPQLSHSEDLRDDLIDLIHQVAQLAEENLRQGRRGALFEKTLQAVTYISNHLVSDEWTGDAEFGSWVSETMLEELERVGAAGASIQNQKAIAQKPKPERQQSKPERMVGSEMTAGIPEVNVKEALEKQQNPITSEGEVTVTKKDDPGQDNASAASPNGVEEKSPKTQ